MLAEASKKQKIFSHTPWDLFEERVLQVLSTFCCCVCHCLTKHLPSWKPVTRCVGVHWGCCKFLEILTVCLQYLLHFINKSQAFSKWLQQLPVVCEKWIYIHIILQKVEKMWNLDSSFSFLVLCHVRSIIVEAIKLLNTQILKSLKC